MLVQIPITLSRVDALLGEGYTRIELWRSNPGVISFAEVTAPVAAAAVLTSKAAQTTYLVGGRRLTLRVDKGADLVVEFSTIIEYWTPSMVVDRINQVIAGLASVSDDATKVVLTSPTTGRASTIEVVYNDAHDLGFVAGQSVKGLEPRIPLVSGQYEYAFVDVAGSEGDLYKWRFSFDGSSPVSDFSDVVEAQASAVDDISTSIGVARFVLLDGRPSKQKVIVAVVDGPLSQSSFLVGTDLPMIFESDSDGYLQMRLVRGVRVRVALEGSTFIREFVVPDQAKFELLTVLTEAPDVFSVTSTHPFLIRRTIE